MRFLFSAVRSIFRRPVLIWFIAAVLFPLLLLSNKYSLLKYIMNDQGIGSLKVFDTYLLILQLAVKYLSSFKNLFFIFVSLAVLSILASILSGVLFSGYFYILYKNVNSYRKKKNDFFIGIKKNFFGIFKAASITFLSAGIVIAAVSFVFVPAVVTLNALLAGKAELFFILILFSIVSIFVLFFSFTFYRIYMLYWFPAVISFKKNSFKAGRYVANNNFWQSMITIIGFDIIYGFSRFIYYSTFMKINSQEIISKAAENRLFVFNWLFFTVFVYLYIYYLFYSFKNSKDQII